MGRLLDVSKVLEGSVRKAGNRIRVTVQLINVADGCHLWSERYEGELTDILIRQISVAIQRALEIQLLGSQREPEGRAQPRPLESYNHYLQGPALWREKNGTRPQGPAARSLRKGGELDRTFVRDTLRRRGLPSHDGVMAAERPNNACPKRQTPPIRALTSTPHTLAEAHTSLAAVKNCYEWDLPAAEAWYQRSHAPRFRIRQRARLEGGLSPSGGCRRAVVAVDSLEQAIELDPLSPPMIADRGLVHALREDFPTAAMYCRRRGAYPHFHGRSGSWD